MVTYTVSKPYHIQRETLDDLLNLRCDRDIISSEMIGDEIHVEMKKGGKRMICMSYYVKFNEGKPKVGWFIPIGLHETEEAYKERSQAIHEMAEGMDPKKLYPIIQKYAVPICGTNGYQHWLRLFVYPRKKPRDGKKEITRIIVDQLVDMGWDPMQMYRCDIPKASDRDKSFVENYIRDKLNGMSDSRIRNELLQIHRNGEYRTRTLVGTIDQDAPDEYSQWERLEHRKQVIVDYMVWLAMGDRWVYEWYAKQAFKKQNHNTAMHMPFNDPSMSYQDRINRDLMLDTKHRHGENEYRNEGHNQLRKNIMHESVKPYDYMEKRKEIMDHYLTNNRFVEQNQEELNLAGAIRLIQTDYFARMKFGEVMKKYGSRGSQYNNDILREVIDIANTAIGSKQKGDRKMANTPEKDLKEQELLQKLLEGITDRTWEPIDLSDVSMSEVETYVSKYLNRDGMALLASLIKNWDTDSKKNYEKDEEKDREKDREEYIREITEEMINSQDPLYVKDGIGKEGSYHVPECAMSDEDYLVKLLRAMTDEELVDFLMEETTDDGYTKIKRLVRHGYQLNELRDIVCENISEYVDLDEYFSDNEEGDEEYDPIIQDFVIDLYGIICSANLAWIHRFMKNYLQDEDSVELYRMIRDRKPLDEIRRHLFEIIVTEYDVDALRQQMVDDPEPVESSAVDMRVVKYLLDGNPDTSEEDEEEGSPVIDEKAKKMIREEIMVRYPGISFEMAFNIYTLSDTLMEEKITMKDVLYVVNTMLRKEDATPVVALAKKGDKADVILAMIDTLVEKYDLEDCFQLFLNSDDDLREVKLREEPEDEEDNSDDVLEEILGIKEDEEEENDEPDRSLHFFHNQMETNNEELSHEEILRDIIQWEAGTAEDESVAERDEFFEWMIQNIPDVDPDDLDKAFDRMSDTAFKRFKQKVLDGVRSGRIKSVEDSSDEDEYILDQGRHADLVRRIRGANISSTDEEEEEESDEMAERNFRRLLYNS